MWKGENDLNTESRKEPDGLAKKSEMGKVISKVIAVVDTDEKDQHIFWLTDFNPPHILSYFSTISYKLFCYSIWITKS